MNRLLTLWTVPLFDSLRQDIVSAFRSFRQARGSSLAVIGSLSVGIAITVAGFALINAFAFPKYPGVVEPDRLVSLFVNGPCGADNCWVPASSNDHEAMRRGLSALDGLAGWLSSRVTVGFREAQSIRAQFVTPEYFEVLGVHPAIGRLYSSRDSDFADESAIVSYAVWREQFNGDPAAIGKSIRVANRSVRIIGVTPAGFDGFLSGPSDMWFPLPLAGHLTSSKSISLVLDHSLRFIGRMRTGVDMNQVRAQSTVVFAQIAQAQGMTTRPNRILIRDIHNNRFATVGVVGIIMFIPVLILFISCVNAANMMLARGTQRTREMAVRFAIGASRGRVVRQILVECLILALAAAALGLLLAKGVLQVVAVESDIALPIDERVLLLTLVTTIVCTLEFGLGPALILARLQPNRLLGTSHSAAGAHGATRTRNILFTVQIALSLGLLVVGQELASRFRKEYETSGTSADQVVLATFDLNQLKITPAESDSFYSELLDRVSKLPQVEAAAVGPSLWGWGTLSHVDSMLATWPVDDKQMRASRGGVVTPGLLKTVGLRVLEGRDFNQDEYGLGEPNVALVSSEFAKGSLNGAALGRVIRVANYSQGYAASVEVRIVGVVESVKDRVDSVDSIRAVYLPSRIHESPQARILYVHSRGRTGSAVNSIRRLASVIDSRVPVLELGTLAQMRDRSREANGLTRIVEWFGVIALFLAAAGLYAVVSYAVSTRFREIAIRMALGAQARSILGMIIRESLAPAVPGAIAGALVTGAVTSLLLFWNNLPVDVNWHAFARSGGELTLALLLAAGIPAVRAARLDPVANLKD